MSLLSRPVLCLVSSGGAPTNRIQSVTSGSTVNYTYDAAGNVTSDGVHVYIYDAENRVRAVDWGTGNQAAYAYDYANRRIKKFTNAAVTYYVWEGSHVIAEHDGTGAPIYNYVYSGAQLIARMGSGIINWYVGDRMSTRLILDANGAVIGRQNHLPFGEEIAGSGTQEKRHFTSYERDSESGLDYAVNRYHASSVGRFSSIDRGSGSPADPQSWNRYSYTRNDPINRSDQGGNDDDELPIIELSLDDLLALLDGGGRWRWIWL